MGRALGGGTATARYGAARRAASRFAVLKPTNAVGGAGSARATGRRRKTASDPQPRSDPARRSADRRVGRCAARAQPANAAWPAVLSRIRPRTANAELARPVAGRRRRCARAVRTGERKSPTGCNAATGFKFANHITAWQTALEPSVGDVA